MRDADVHTSLLEHVAWYFDACDRGDFDAVMEVLSGATVQAGGMTLTDPTAIRRMYESRQPAPAPDGRRRTKHHVTNLRVEGPDGDGAHLVHAYYFRLEPGDAHARVTASGRLEQVVVRDGRGWRVVRHAIVSDF